MSQRKRDAWQFTVMKAPGWTVLATVLISAAWAGWDVRSFHRFQKAIIWWPAIACSAALISGALMQNLRRNGVSASATTADYFATAAICWLVLLNQPVAGLYMASAGVGYSCAVVLLKRHVQDFLSVRGAAATDIRTPLCYLQADIAASSSFRKMNASSRSFASHISWTCWRRR